MENEIEQCKNCKSWLGPGEDVDHAHCKDQRSPQFLNATSKYGDKDYDHCIYFTTKQPLPLSRSEIRKFDYNC